jgi:type IV pilus assembly protein PilY1
MPSNNTSPKDITHKQNYNNMTNTSNWLRRLMWAAIPLIGAASFYALSQVANPLAVNLSAEPLYAKGSGAKPTISLALSVEFPTVGAQYLDSYTVATEYVGYFDADSCYTYNNNADEALRRFDRLGAATAHTCGGNGFSGNFMNWATGSAIDVLRLGLTGGDRIKDEENLTILQRAVIRNSFFNSSGNFPSKTLAAALVDGAVPSTLKGAYAGDIKIANCLNRVHFGTTQTGTCDTPGNNANLGANLSSNKFFYTRVQVCETTDPRTVDGFCLKYPSGKFKPVGNLQKYSDRVRIAAFGYLKDDTLARYGGVLRAPMKFIGPNTYDENGALLAGVNSKVEWDPVTGVFKTNPEGVSEGVSGVINYLNQFGRTSTTSQGEYKTYDPVGELYYETLRYLQGLQPTPEAVSNITTVMKDGFPVYTAWTDPHAGGNKTSDYSCLKNNIIVVGDKNTHADKSLPGNTSTTSSDFARSVNLANNEPNFRNWTNVVGGFEAKSSVSYLDGIGDTRNTNHPSNTNAANTDPHYPNLQDALPYTCCNNNSYLMAGAAYWANTHDIRSADNSSKRLGMRAKTYVIDVNEGGGSTDPNARKNNQFLLAAKYGGFTDKSDIGNPFLKVTARDAAGKPTTFTLDNSGWQKAAVNPASPGDPKNYYLASSSKAVLAGLNEIFDSIASEGNSIANGSISSTSFKTGGYVYNASFDPTDWSGDVISTPVSATAGVVNVGVNTPQWKAAAVMNANSVSYFKNTRNIIAGRSKSNSNGAEAGIPFKWSNVSSDNGSLKAALNNETTALPAGDGLGEDRLNYLRGDKSKEGTPFRSRSSRLGDIVNSPVVYSKEFGNDVNTAAYKTFATNNASRPGALFVGANDGMLHAFNSATGAEIFAYIPSWLASKLPALTDPTYNSSKHQSYVDGQTWVAEALVGSTWKTVLLSSTGGGGQGIFALDVSNPAAFDEKKVMWEFTDKDDPDLGNVMGTSKVVKIQTNKKTDATPIYEWFAAVPSGVNNFVADGSVSTSKKPYLFLLSLNKTAGQAWSLGSNYFKFEIPTDATLSATVSPGVINFEAVTGSAGEIDQMYLGDLHGNLWKLDFDLANTGTSGKALSSLTFADLITGNSNKPLFVAKDDAGNVQPIAMTPTIVYGPNKGSIVMFGTGKYMEASDNNLTPVRTQSVYAIHDIDASPRSVAGRAFLQKGTASSGVISVPTFIWGRASTTGDTSQRSGWYFDYPTSGERSVSDFTVSGNKIYFGSVVPPQNLSDPCNGGGGNIYDVNFATGNGNSQVSTVGLIGQIFVQETTDASLTASDSTGRRAKTSTKRLLIKGTDGYKTPPQDEIEVTAVGRLSWRQINNYYELKK